MKKLALIFLLLTSSSYSFAQAVVMNPGETYGQVVVLTVADVKNQTPKYKSLSAISIPVYGELPLEMTVVAGAVTLLQQTILSHVQLKSRACHTPNLDISQLQGGLSNPNLALLKDGAWIHMKLGADQTVLIEPSNQATATAFASKRPTMPRCTAL